LGRRAAAVIGAVLIAAASVAKAPLELEIGVGHGAFSPSSFTLRRGETVRVVVSSSDGVEHCFAIDGLRVEKRVRPGQKTAFDLTPDRAGTYVVYCCLRSAASGHKEEAQLTVVE
jgi:heme/copper-type cytochrome/quinol oxidase subunit 2